MIRVVLVIVSTKIPAVFLGSHVPGLAWWPASKSLIPVCTHRRYHCNKEQTK